MSFVAFSVAMTERFSIWPALTRPMRYMIYGSWDPTDETFVDFVNAIIDKGGLRNYGKYLLEMHMAWGIEQ